MQVERPAFRERCQREATRSVVFLFQRRELVGFKRPVEVWYTEGVWLSREEAEDYGNRHHYNYRDGWRVYGVCSNGELAELIKTT